MTLADWRQPLNNFAKRKLDVEQTRPGSENDLLRLNLEKIRKKQPLNEGINGKEVNRNVKNCKQPLTVRNFDKKEKSRNSK